MGKKNNVEAPPPSVTLIQMATSYWVSAALNTVAKLGIADLLKDGPKTPEALAKAGKAHPQALYRLLRCMAGHGVFAERKDGKFENTPASDLLRSDLRGSMRSMVLFQNAEWHWKIYMDLLYCVQTGDTGAERALGAPIFDYMSKHPDDARVFDEAMRGFSESINPAIVQAYDYSGFRRIVDVGGGYGGLISGILKAHPKLKGIIYEMPHVVDGARKNLDSLSLAPRCEVIGGDFFKSVPEGADAYIMKFIIHDWDDERASRILKNISKAMAKGGKVLTVEMVVPPGNDPHFSKVLDLEMLALPGGRERTEKEFRDLYASAGLKLTRLVPTSSPFFIIEGEKK